MDLIVTAAFDDNGLKKGLDSVQKELAQTGIAAAKLDSSLKKATGGFNTAGQSLQNLGRIAQDAPFGFIGIQNNINPLIESFQRLKTETGSSGKAFKALAGSLVGAGGIGLAVSVLTGVLTILAQKGFFTAGKASTEAADEIKKFNKTIEDTKAAGIAAGLSLQGFVAIARDQTQSLETRNAALEKANKILGDHGDKLTLVNVATQAVTEQINKFTEATIQQALATKFADRAADLIIKRTDAQKVYNEALNAEQITRKRLAGTVGDFGGAAFAELNRVINKTKDAAGAYKLIAGEVESVKSQLTASQLSASKLFGELNGAGKITGIIAKLKAQIKDLTDQQPNLISEKAIKENVASIRVLQAELDRLLGKEHNVKETKAVKAIKAVKEEVDKIIAEIKSVNDERIAIGGQVTILDPTKLQEAVDSAVAAGKQGAALMAQQIRDAFNEQIADSVKNMLTSSLSGIGDAIGNTIAKGGDIGKAIFGNLFQVLADGLKQIGESLIALGTAKIAIEKFNFAPGVGTVIAGVATVALAAILRASMPKFASGGFVSGPGTSKSDSIHARLSTGEYVMSADTVKKFGKSYFDMLNGGGRPRNGGFASGGSVSGGNIGGGFTQTIIPDVVVRGSDLLLVFDRASSRRGRNG